MRASVVLPRGSPWLVQQTPQLCHHRGLTLRWALQEVSSGTDVSTPSSRATSLPRLPRAVLRVNHVSSSSCLTVHLWKVPAVDNLPAILNPFGQEPRCDPQGPTCIWNQQKDERNSKAGGSRRQTRNGGHTSSDFRAVVSVGVGQVQPRPSQVGQLKTPRETPAAQSHPAGNGRVRAEAAVLTFKSGAGPCEPQLSERV